MYCKSCKNEINDNSLYCSNCGEKVQKENEVHEESQLENKNKIENKPRGKSKLIIGISILIIMGLIYMEVGSNKINPISKGKLENIDISLYFPQQVGTKKYYKLVLETGEQLYNGEEQIIASEKINNGTRIIMENYSPLLDGDLSSSTLYQISKDEVKILESNNAVIGYSNNKVVILNKEPIKESEESIVYITSVDKTIDVEAGKFEDCIEITEEITTEIEGYDGLYIKTYFAPNVGQILKTVVDNVKSDYGDLINYELIGYELPNNQISDKIDKNVDESGKKEPKDDIKPNQDNLKITNNNDKIIIEDTEFNFTMEVPDTWKDNYIIEKTDSSQYNVDLGNTYYKTLDFLYTPQGLEPQYMFSLVVFNSEKLDNILEEQAEAYRGSSVINNGEYYIERFTVPELSEEVVNNEDPIHVSMMMVMINQDLPEILNSIEFFE